MLKFIAIAIALSGCASMEARYAESEARHPCGNVWDICPGDNKAVDKIKHVLEGKN